MFFGRHGFGVGREIANLPVIVFFCNTIHLISVPVDLKESSLILTAIIYTIVFALLLSLHVNFSRIVSIMRYTIVEILEQYAVN